MAQDAFVSARSILSTCANLGVPLKSTLILGGGAWREAVTSLCGGRTMGFADPATLARALLGATADRPVDAVRAQGGAAVRGGLCKAFNLLTVDAAVCPPDAVAALPLDFASLNAVGLHFSEPLADLNRLTGADRALFDLGFLRVSPAGVDERDRRTFLYIRSYHLGYATHLDGRRAHRVTLAGMPRLGRFANQILQFAGMTLYGARNNAATPLPEWMGNVLFHIPPAREEACETPYVCRSFTLDELALWDAEAPAPVDVDFEIFFQVFPRLYETHRTFIRNILRFQDRIAARIHAWFDANLPADATLVTIHVRRGDYLLFQNDAPWFRVIPIDWYRSFLERVWPSLSNPRLVVATDDPRVIEFFRDYRPLDLRPAFPHLVNGGFVADFIALQRADIALISNSSFSRSAVLLSQNDHQAVFKPGWAFGGFVPVDPWADRVFWDWYSPIEPASAEVLAGQAAELAAAGNHAASARLHRLALIDDPSRAASREAARGTAQTTTGNMA